MHSSLYTQNWVHLFLQFSILVNTIYLKFYKKFATSEVALLLLQFDHHGFVRLPPDPDVGITAVDGSDRVTQRNQTKNKNGGFRTPYSFRSIIVMDEN